MTPFALVFAITAHATAKWQPFQAQFMRSVSGRTVTVCIDNQFVETTFAGKMMFRDNGSTWLSVCANVRAPISQGSTMWIQPANSAKVGGNIAKAGVIVARYFRDAQSPDQCAGLQLAVWKAIEDGGALPDFSVGRFQARADADVIAYAQKYYMGAQDYYRAQSNGSNGLAGQLSQTPPSALYLGAATAGQSQLAPTPQ